MKNTHNILSNEIVENSGEVPYLCASSENNGVSSHIAFDADYLEEGNCIFIGGKTFVVSYQPEDFFSNDSHNLALYFKDEEKRTKNIQTFMVSCIQKGMGFKYSWGNSISSKKIQNDFISLPITSSGEIDFDFMESFIRELEEERIRELAAYLKVSGLDNYKLSKSESEALAHFEGLEWKEFSFKEIFNRIEQGRRLKKDDQLPGDIPFVMSGVTNTGVVGYVSNPVASFPANSITVDIFGNAFYRDYSFGAGDDTGVYWNTEKQYSKLAMLFFTSAMNKALFGKFSYGKKLRSSQSLDIKMCLPVRDGVPDYSAMETFISAVQKLVIKDVVLYADRKIAAAKEAVKEREKSDS